MTASSQPSGDDGDITYLRTVGDALLDDLAAHDDLEGRLLTIIEGAAATRRQPAAYPASVGVESLHVSEANGALGVHVEPTFEAFYAEHQAAWVRYAYALTGSHDAAELITDAVTADMAAAWHQMQSAESAARHAWKAITTAVERWHDEHGNKRAVVEAAAVYRVQSALERSRDRFAAMPESLGLYSAIARLPKRQYDVIVLRFVLGYSYDAIAPLLGISQTAVRSAARQARIRLAQEIGLAEPSPDQSVNAHITVETPEPKRRDTEARLTQDFEPVEPSAAQALNADITVETPEPDHHGSWAVSIDIARLTAGTRNLRPLAAVRIIRAEIAEALANA